MQILVVIANIQAKPSKAEVEKGSTRTSIDCGVVAPEGGGERRDTAGTASTTLSRARVPGRSKGNRASIPEPRHGDLPARPSATAGRWAWR